MVQSGPILARPLEEESNMVQNLNAFPALFQRMMQPQSSWKFTLTSARMHQRECGLEQPSPRCILKNLLIYFSFCSINTGPHLSFLNHTNMNWGMPKYHTFFFSPVVHFIFWIKSLKAVCFFSRVVVQLVLFSVFVLRSPLHLWCILLRLGTRAGASQKHT